MSSLVPALSPVAPLAEPVADRVLDLQQRADAARGQDTPNERRPREKRPAADQQDPDDAAQVPSAPVWPSLHRDSGLLARMIGGSGLRRHAADAAVPVPAQDGVAMPVEGDATTPTTPTEQARITTPFTGIEAKLSSAQSGGVQRDVGSPAKGAVGGPSTDHETSGDRSTSFLRPVAASMPAAPAHAAEAPPADLPPPVVPHPHGRQQKDHGEAAGSVVQAYGQASAPAQRHAGPPAPVDLPQRPTGTGAATAVAMAAPGGNKAAATTTVSVAFSSYGPGHTVTASWSSAPTGWAMPALVVRSNSEQGHRAVANALSQGITPGGDGWQVQASQDVGDDGGGRHRHAPQPEDEE